MAKMERLIIKLIVKEIALFLLKKRYFQFLRMHGLLA